jgi:hypothetical protein
MIKNLPLTRLLIYNFSNSVPHRFKNPSVKMVGYIVYTNIIVYTKIKVYN